VLHSHLMMSSVVNMMFDLLLLGIQITESIEILVELVAFFNLSGGWVIHTEF
jgi:hypothetical protein